MAVGKLALPVGGSSGPDCCFYEKTTGYSFYGGLSADWPASYLQNPYPNFLVDKSEYFLGFEYANFLMSGISPLDFSQMTSGTNSLSFLGSDGKWYVGNGSGSNVPFTGGQDARAGVVGTATNWTNVCTNTLSGNNVYGINSIGELYVYGTNSNGELGIGSTTNVTGTAVQKVTTLAGNNWTMVSAANNFAVGIHNGGLYVCGNNANNRTGRNTTSGNTISWTAPYNVDTAATDVKTDWVYCNAGNNGFVAIDSSGALWGAGQNRDGRFGTGNSTTQVGIKKVVNSGVSKAYLSERFCFYIDTAGLMYHSGYGFGGIAGSSTTTFTNKIAGNWTTIDFNRAGASTPTALIGKKTDGLWYYWGSNLPMNSFRKGRWMPNSAYGHSYTTYTPVQWPYSPTSLGFVFCDTIHQVIIAKYP